MGSNRYQKPAPPQYQARVEKKKLEEVVLNFTPCLTCGKQITEGYWGAYANGGVCSKICNITYQKNRPSLIDYVISNKE